MSISRVRIWIPGDVLTAEDLNAEFDNIVFNPIELISPTSGVIDFNSQLHHGLKPSALVTSSGSDNQVLTIIGGQSVWSSAAIVSTGSGGSTFPSVSDTNAVVWEDFNSRTAASGTVWGFGTGSWEISNAGTGSLVQFGDNSFGIRLTGSAVGSNMGGLTWCLNESGGSAVTPINPAKLPTVYARFAQHGSTGTGTSRIGSAVAAIVSGLVDDTHNGMYFKWVESSTLHGVTNDAASVTTIASTVTMANHVFHTGKIVMRSSVAVDFYVDGTLIGTSTANIPSVNLGLACGTFGPDNGTDGIDTDYLAYAQPR